MADDDLSTPRPRTNAEVRRILVERFPLCFMPAGAEKKPLKVGIRDDIVDACPDLPEREIKFALIDYTCGFKYVRNMQEGASRVDLGGGHAGVVTKDEAIVAAARVNGLKAKMARKSAQRADARAGFAG